MPERTMRIQPLMRHQDEWTELLPQMALFPGTAATAICRKVGWMYRCISTYVIYSIASPFISHKNQVDEVFPKFLISFGCLELIINSIKKFVITVLSANPKGGYALLANEIGTFRCKH